MKNSWTKTFRRLAAASVVSGSVAWSSAMCYAVQLAFDNAADPVYADGWQGTTTDNITGAQSPLGDNGGFGFEPWNFDTDWLFNPDPIDGVQAIDDGLKSGGGNANSSPFNDIGRAWRMANPVPVAGVTGLPRAGRGFAPLQVGQTIRMVIDNPTTQQFFKGYLINFSSRGGEAGGGNICYDYPGYSTACSAADLNGNGNYVPLGATPEPKLGIQRFENFDDGQWVVVNQADADPDGDGHPIPLFDVDTAVAGAQIDFKLTGVDTYELTIDPFGPAPTHVETGTLITPGEQIDWLEFTLFNTTTNAASATDLYIKSIEIIGDAAPGVPGDYNNNNKVDAADYTVWRDHLGASFQLPNEVSGVTPGSVTSEDYNEWKARFGNMPPGAGAGGAAVGVPEPGTFLGFVTGFMAWVGLRFRRGSANGDKTGLRS